MPDSTAWHEAGHSAAVLALRRHLKLVTARPGQAWAGCTSFTGKLIPGPVPDVKTPPPTWGARWQQHMFADAIFYLSGDLAEDLFARRQMSRLPEPVAEVALDRLATAGPELATPAEVAEAADSVNDTSLLTDADALARQLFVMFGRDVPRAAAYTAYASEETRALLLASEDGVGRLAVLLDEHGVVGGRAAAAALKGAGR